MDIGTQVEYFGKEHDDFLRFLDQFEPAVAQLASRQDHQRLQGLKTLREMEDEVRGIRNHCSSEERNGELRYSRYLGKGELGQLQQDHEELGRLVSTWAIELRFATLDQTNAAQAAGRQLAAFLRQHITLEEKLLREIERKLSEEAEQKLLLRYTRAPE